MEEKPLPLTGSIIYIPFTFFLNYSGGPPDSAIVTLHVRFDRIANSYEEMRDKFSEAMDIAAENVWTISIATPPPASTIPLRFAMKA